MILTNNDAKYFYDLWIPLLDYVNKKYKILPELYGMSSPAGLPIQKIAIITNKLWEDTTLIDEYISSSDSLNQNDKAQIMMWKDYSIHDKFIVDRHLKDGSIFISLQNRESISGKRDLFINKRNVGGTSYATSCHGNANPI